jgi:NAD(P)-dependent dehydrogenase (short-subunit alcohol dehydrogenase family)
MSTNGRVRWTAADVADQSGRVAVITGASGGLGLQVATVLAGRGASVVLACRDPAKAGAAADRIRAAASKQHTSGPTAHRQPNVVVVRLDLASLDSVRGAAGEIRDLYPGLDLLINNAAVMRPPYRRTADGFELTFGTNHLGHFALTGLLLDRLLARPGSRVVTVSSVGHREGVMRFDDLQFERGYHADHAYAQSKLANLLFSYELAERLQRAGLQTTALAAHPGVASTGLFRWDPLLTRALISHAMRPLTFRVVHSAQRGALPILRAATDPTAGNGQYYGPSRRNECTGLPMLVQSSSRSHDQADMQRLWEISEQLTGVCYRFG